LQTAFVQAMLDHVDGAGAVLGVRHEKGSRAAAWFLRNIGLSTEPVSALTAMPPLAAIRIRPLAARAKFRYHSPAIRDHRSCGGRREE
jgi:hypothetical protein